MNFRLLSFSFNFFFISLSLVSLKYFSFSISRFLLTNVCREELKNDFFLYFFEKPTFSPLSEFYLTEGVVAAIALRFLVATAVHKSAGRSSVLVGLLVTLIANNFASFKAHCPKVLKKVPNRSASIVLSETFLVLTLLHILQSFLKKLKLPPLFS